MKGIEHDVKMKSSGKKFVSPGLWENQRLRWSRITVTRSNSSPLPSSSLDYVTMWIISLIQLETNGVKTYVLPQMQDKGEEQVASEKHGNVSISSTEVRSWSAMLKTVVMPSQNSGEINSLNWHKLAPLPEEAAVCPISMLILNPAQTFYVAVQWIGSCYWHSWRLWEESSNREELFKPALLLREKVSWAVVWYVNPALKLLVPD